MVHASVAGVAAPPMAVTFLARCAGLGSSPRLGIPCSCVLGRPRNSNASPAPRTALPGMRQETLTSGGKIFGKMNKGAEPGRPGNNPSAPPLAMQMPTPMQVWNPWVALSAQAALLGLEAQRVMALRLMRLAAGGVRGQAEAQRMMTEKFAAAAEAQAAAVAGAIEGGIDHRAGKKILGVYKRRVRANRRRLSR